MRPDIRQRQEELEDFGRKHGWRRGPFRSWKVGGFTISVGATGQPRKFVAAGRHERRGFKELDEVRFFLAETDQTKR